MSALEGGSEFTSDPCCEPVTSTFTENKFILSFLKLENYSLLVIHLGNSVNQMMLCELLWFVIQGEFYIYIYIYRCTATCELLQRTYSSC